MRETRTPQLVSHPYNLPCGSGNESEVRDRNEDSSPWVDGDRTHPRNIAGKADPSRHRGPDHSAHRGGEVDPPVTTKLAHGSELLDNRARHRSLKADRKCGGDKEVHRADLVRTYRTASSRGRGSSSSLLVSQSPKISAFRSGLPFSCPNKRAQPDQQIQVEKPNRADGIWPNR